MSTKNRTGRADGYMHQAGQPSVSVTQERASYSQYDAADVLGLVREHQLLASLPAMIFTSGPDGAWDYVNPSFCAYTGYPESSLIGLGWAAALHVDDRVASLSRWQSAIRSGTPLVIEHRLRCANGSHHWFRMQCAPQYGAAGEIIRWVGISTPIEAEHQVEHERELRRAAEQALDSHDGVIAIAAHELRAPLTVLLGQAQMLQRRLAAREAADPRDRRSVDVLVDQSLRLARLLSAMLDVAAVDNGLLRISQTTLDLSVLVQQVVQSLQPSMASHTLRLSADVSPLWVSGDALRIEQVIQNLIQNAEKYSPAGSDIAIWVTSYGSQARISVRDHGIGIAASSRPYLFQRFFRAKGADSHAAPGLGLGLYICKAIIDLHGGSIEVESAVGAGSTFTILLPQLC
ncbi:PAS domain-containing sensor histidine kinase [Oscillochloris sp. ZM17-4]|uniref:PAS domain-containing sensor histidine kinase n=1 Tax=Oscillochloris sp. ZM17-4 TaxID=2866714 RepID=UPI001C733802|nr:PAS domain-containing sensor histidine kinase [Oscillochloris sp. ZM17-4]MBX0330955.1 PAS domain-containing sensor histidine kinase [Oscillochloris sp. ZM17-4]